VPPKVAAATLDPSSAERSLAETIAARRRALTCDEFAEIMGLAKNTVYEWAKEGRIPAIRMGGAIRLDPKSLADWLRKNGG